MNPIIGDPLNPRQLISQKLNQLKPRNQELWLKSAIAEKPKDGEGHFQMAACLAELHQRFPTGKMQVGESRLNQALDHIEKASGVDAKMRQDLWQEVLIYLGNVYVDQSLYFEALDCFQKASTQKGTHYNSCVARLNVVRCKVWFRDLSDARLIFLEEICSDATFPDELVAYRDLIQCRLDLLSGALGQVRERLSQLKSRHVEAAYLECVRTIIDQWDTGSILGAYTKLKGSGALGDEDRSFYEAEGEFLSLLQHMRRGRKITSQDLNRLRRFERKVSDQHFGDCVRQLLELLTHRQSNLARRLAFQQRFSRSLASLLIGAHDFTFQFASVLWLKYLWEHGHKTEFGRYFIEYQGYVARLLFELNLPSGTSPWFAKECQAFEAKYRLKVR
jgi:tetratricopeptide (TPR) repeat protein